MATLLWIIAGYIVLDRLLAIGRIGKHLTVTPGVAVGYVITGAFIVTVLVLAATRGVTP